jgi:hypothetical protein
VDLDDLLREHGIDVARLEPAPPGAVRRDVVARVCEVPPRPCSVCGEPAATARLLDGAGDGRRWIDLCWPHGRATAPRWRGPTTVKGIVADLREAAAEARVPLRLWTEEEAWRDDPQP